MKLDKAKAIVLEIAGARRKWGKQANPPYSIHQIMDALVLLSDEIREPKQEGLSPEEVTKLRRQLAACTNREKLKKEGVAHDADVHNGVG